MGKVIAVANQKGGVGKSTITTNLAVAYQNLGHTVVIVEADPSVFTVSRWADDREANGKTPVLTLRKTGRLKEALTDLASRYDVVLVDLPGKDSPEMRSALLAATVVLIPTQPTQADLDATIDMNELLTTSAEYNPTLHVFVVLNRVSTNAWSTEAQESREILEPHYDTVLKTEIHDRKMYKDSLSDGVSVLEAKNRLAAAEIRDLAQEILRTAEDKESADA